MYLAVAWARNRGPRRVGPQRRVKSIRHAPLIGYN